MPAKIKFTEEQLKEIKHLYLDEEWSITKISERFDCSSSVITNRLKNMGIKMRPPGFQKGNKLGAGRSHTEDLTG